MLVIEYRDGKATLVKSLADRREVSTLCESAEELATIKRLIAKIENEEN